MTARLCEARIAQVPQEVGRPAYDRKAQRVGIVHVGIGAFHRGHQAVYTEDAMARGDRNWAVTGVSLRSSHVRDSLQPQDGLYTLAERDATGERLRVIGAVRNVLVAKEDAEAVIAALASPDVHIATFTVTEKGYWRDSSSGSLLVDASDIAHDLRGDAAPRTLYGFLERALARRKAAGLSGLSLVSCDNLAENGRQLSALLVEFLERRNPSLAAWARNEISCPSTMVDRIVPATTQSDLERIEGALRMQDRAAVVTEHFHHWVIEDRFVGPRPRWEEAGARWVADVRPYETAKLRMLNGSHSALAYIGLSLGHEYVHQAITDPDLGPIVRQLMCNEAAASLAPTAGQDLTAYAEALIERFNNPSLAHRLAQIATDGTQKIPQRWLAPLAALEQSGRPAPSLLFALAAWIAFICTTLQRIDDPLAARLAGIREAAGADARAAAGAVVGPSGIFRDVWQTSAAALRTIETHVETMMGQGMRRALVAFRR